MTITFSTARTLATESDTIQISEEDGVIVVDPSEKRVFNSRPRVIWTAPFDFMLDFGKMGHSPVGHGQYKFDAKPHQGAWRVVAHVKDVNYDTRLKYDVVTAIGTLDPVIIIDPN